MGIRCAISSMCYEAEGKLFLGRFKLHLSIFCLPGTGTPQDKDRGKLRCFTYFEEKLDLRIALI